MAASVPVVFVHGIRASATMFDTPVAALRRAGIPTTAIDLPGHGTRRGEPFTLDSALAAIDDAVRAFDEPVLLAGHSLGGYLGIEYCGRDASRIAGLAACDCSTPPRGPIAAAYGAFARLVERLPDSGAALNAALARLTLPEQGRAELERGGYAFDVMAAGIQAVLDTDPVATLRRLDAPIWFVNGTLDHFRMGERTFAAAAPHGRVRLIRRAHHVMPLVRPDAFTRAILEIHDELAG